MIELQKVTTKKRPSSLYGFGRLGDDIRRNYLLYIMLIPLILFYGIFCYGPMYGIIIAFKDFSMGKGIMGSPWTSDFGFRHFIDFLTGSDFKIVFPNTIMLSLGLIVFSFPAPIIFAILLNEVKNVWFKRGIQTITYIPYFISVMVVCGLLYTFLGRDGLVNDLIEFFGGTRSNLLANPSYFKTIFIVSDIWQNLGWGSIIYIAAIAGIDQELYEASSIDGAGRFRQMLCITLPGILPTVLTLFILRMGSVFSVSYEKVILLINDMNRSKAEVISSHVYRRGMIDADYSYSTAVGLFNNILNFTVLLITNHISKKMTETSLW